MINLIVYYSSNTNYTKRFAEKLDIPSVRIPVSSKEDIPVITEPYVLLIPTYGGGVSVDHTHSNHNAIYKIDPEWEPPKNWSVRLQEETGRMIIKAPKFYRSGDKITIPVTLEEPKDLMEPVLPQIYKFLDHADNASWMRGVISSGNTNFGEDYGIAADKISMLYNVPSLYRYELLGNEQDVQTVMDGIKQMNNMKNM